MILWNPNIRYKKYKNCVLNIPHFLLRLYKHS